MGVSELKYFETENSLMRVKFVSSFVVLFHFYQFGTR